MRKIGFEYFSMKIAFTLLSSPPEYLFQPLIYYLIKRACSSLAIDTFISRHKVIDLLCLWSCYLIAMVNSLEGLFSTM